MTFLERRRRDTFWFELGALASSFAERSKSNEAVMTWCWMVHVHTKAVPGVDGLLVRLVFEDILGGYSGSIRLLAATT